MLHHDSFLPPVTLSRTKTRVSTDDDAARHLLTYAVSGPQRNIAREIGERQRRIETFRNDKEDRIPQRLAEGSKLPAWELARAQSDHGQDGQSRHTTNCSEAGDSTVARSVAPSISVGSSEPSESYSSSIDHSLPRPLSDGRVRGPPSIHSDKTGSHSAPPLTSSQSSHVSSLSVSDSMGERALDQSMRLLQEDGTVGDTLFHRGPVLECQFRRYTGCKKRFPVSNFEVWVMHNQKHFTKHRRGERSRDISPPTLNSCCFCDEKFEAVSGILSWRQMMSHVKEHHELGNRLAHARIDFSLVEYLWQNGLLTLQEYRDLKPNTNRNAQHLPSPPLSDDEEPVAVLEEKRHRGARTSVRGRR